MDAGDRRSQETRREGQERLRIAGRLEIVAAGDTGSIRVRA
jgi:hypothetical protein